MKKQKLYVNIASIVLCRSMLIVATVVVSLCVSAQHKMPQKPRVLISTDIGGTDPDDNQSMIHLLMYSDLFDIEGLVSSPSFGNGSADEIRRMISIYAKDYPRLKKRLPGLMAPCALRRLCKQGRSGLAPFKGYDKPTEGSRWIVRQALKRSNRPLWILVWGTLEDVAQALHDAPEIKDRIRVYCIGGPNKKWGVNSYAYIAENFPDLWMIENNATYRGLITDRKASGPYDADYYDTAMRGAGAMGADFVNYYGGIVKMGDTPSLLYLMDGDPENPMKDCWGGRFMKTRHSARHVFENRRLSMKDTVRVYSVMEMMFSGPVADIPEDSVCFVLNIDKQNWNGYYAGNGTYVVRYVPKAPATLTYIVSSGIAVLNGLSGTFVVSREWPGRPSKDDYQLGENWFTDVSEAGLFEGLWQGAATVRRWHDDIMKHWLRRWNYLK